METIVIQRFKNVISELLESKKAKSKKEIADSLGLSASYFSELLNNRINLSADHIQRICRFYHIDPRYIFGYANMIFINTPPSSLEEYGDFDTEIELTPPSNTSDHVLKKHDSRKNVSPTYAKNVSPTVSPTPENCRICDEKERIISSMEITIEALQEANIQLKKRLIEQEKDQRQVG